VDVLINGDEDERIAHESLKVIRLPYLVRP